MGPGIPEMVRFRPGIMEHKSTVDCASSEGAWGRSGLIGCVFSARLAILGHAQSKDVKVRK